MVKWKKIDRAQLTGEKSDRLVYLTPPHAPSLVTTISPNGAVNVGVFEQTMLGSNNPPMMLLVISPKSDTLYNLRDMKKCVIGFPYPDKLQETYDAGVRLPRGKSELDFVKGLSTIDHINGEPPRLELCWFSAEGELVWDKESGDHVVCCVEIASVTIDEEIWHEDKTKRRTGLPASYYAAAGEFFSVGDWTHIEMSEEIKNIKHAG